MMVFALADTPAWLRAAIDAFRGRRVMGAPQSRATNRLGECTHRAPGLSFVSHEQHPRARMAPGPCTHRPGRARPRIGGLSTKRSAPDSAGSAPAEPDPPTGAPAARGVAAPSATSGARSCGHVPASGVTVHHPDHLLAGGLQ